MKITICIIIPTLLIVTPLMAQDQPAYTNIIRQVRLPSGAVTEVGRTAMEGTNDQSAVTVTAGGSRFELYSINKASLISYHLATANVGTIMPEAKVVIDTEDPYGKTSSAPYTNPDFENASIALKGNFLPVNDPLLMRRTRADKPFKVYVQRKGLNERIDAAECYKSLNFRRHLLSYGTSLTGEGVDRTKVALASPALPQFSSDGIQNATTFGIDQASETDIATFRGEETFSVWTLNDTQIPNHPIAEKMVASQTLQVWPESSGAISGITNGQTIRFAAPTVTFQYTDTYPLSTTYAQVYKGPQRDGVEGAIVPGSSVVNTSTSSKNYVQTSGLDFAPLFTSDGQWTIEIVTVSVFDKKVLSSVDTIVDRSIKVNGAFTTIE